MIKNPIKKLLIFALTLSFVFVVIGSPVFFPPVSVHAQSIGIPCDGGATDQCDFDDLIQLAKNIMNFLILLSIPVATIAFAWAGILMLTARGNESQVAKAKEIFTKVLIGFLFVLTAWLIVQLITGALLKEGAYKDLLKQGSSPIMREFVLDMSNMSNMSNVG